MPLDICLKIDSRIVKVGARKILRVDRPAKLETLHFAAGTHSYRNLAVMRMAEQLDLILSAGDSSFKDGLESKYCMESKSFYKQK